MEEATIPFSPVASRSVRMVSPFSLKGRHTPSSVGPGEVTTAASGAMQSIIYLEDGTLYGVGDPRQDGKASIWLFIIKPKPSTITPLPK